MANADSHDDLTRYDLATLADKFRRREVSPVAATEAYLARIEATEPRLNAYITVTADIARAAARKAEEEIVRGEWRGPLHGIPIALKDLCYTRGIRTTAGSKILADFVPDHDATVYRRLREAGAVMLGKLNLHEFAAGASSNNPHYGPVRNPYDLERIPGGSSGGSAAALVARSALGTIGTDTGGSIRIPAALSGCVGLKPTYGRVSRYGVAPLAYSVDHVGPMARTVRDTALMLNVIAGHDRDDSTSSIERVPDFTAALGEDIAGMRLGVVEELCRGLDDEVGRSFDAALAALAGAGALIDRISIPVLTSPAARAARTLIVRAEALEIHERWLLERPGDYGDDVRKLLELGIAVPASSYVRAQRVRALMLAQSESALAKFDLLVSPACPITAPRIGEESITMPDGSILMVLPALAMCCAPFNATGQPAIAVPIGLSSTGLPIAIQFAGRAFDEAGVLRAAYAYESLRGPLPPPPE
jgi:aspartyl-tRNA(Asn)/glutamyl-tRNA(Gln) amidotransferase subunit A